MGLPLAVVLLKPELDLWQPGEHNGTFRGNNHAFVTATAALQLYWQDLSFSAEVKRKAQLLRNGLQDILDSINHPQLRLKGRGFMQGIECPDGAIADQVTEQAFNRGMVIETSGNVGQVVKCLCPLVISDEELAQGLAILKQSFTAVFDGKLSQAV
jgi:diaminobutyrate-2-oxoglutarate transaminase